MKLALLLLVLTAVYARADQWTYFYPESVISFGCRADLMEVFENGSHSREVWEAEAWAKRKEQGDWAMTVGIFPPDIKGRHQAEKVCSQWMDQASKRVKKAQ